MASRALFHLHGAMQNLTEDVIYRGRYVNGIGRRSGFLSAAGGDFRAFP